MKSKAKPAKGSARTKRFDVGGTVGALAGLGTLAYLMSRKKKGADESSDVAARRASGAYRGGVGTDTTTDTKPSGPFKDPDVITKDTAQAEKDRMNESVETHRKITSGGSSDSEPDTTPVSTNNNKPSNQNQNQNQNRNRNRNQNRNQNQNQNQNQNRNQNRNQGSSTNNAPAYTGQGMAGSDKGAPRVPALKGGESKVEGEGTLKPYPANLPAVKEAERRKLLQRRVTTAGDPNKKEPTSAGFKRIQSAVQGTLDNAGKSTVRSDKEKMAAGAREVERRRQEAKAAKQGYGIKKGGMVKKYASGGSVSSASKRADGIAMRGKTKGRMV